METSAVCIVFSVIVCLLWMAPTESRMMPGDVRIPDEQRLYRALMSTYESSVRPVHNASKTILINFRLSLNQIVDLDERKQVLTTNVFIDQEWEDDNLKWDVGEYNGIRTMRVPAQLVWLPDTFIFNNADDGSTGFMNGLYVVLNANGSVLWPVPVKLKSSCHVDITYFPFDDQRCILRFGSWIYSGEWMDFVSSLESVDMEYYIDNSEWELVAIQYEKNIRKYACCPSPHPDLTFTLHMRRRTFYYIFNIIVPCIMLSVLTLLTFWLPTTSGEKISLGLSVFLAFSMFMLLIAEEVPATSKSVPIIGVYLTTVMTMTSVSVIMSVMVINLYNRGYRAKPAPAWLKVLILSWLCRLLGMKHDIERLAKAIRLEEEEEAKYMCEKHEVAGVFPRRRFGRTPRPTPRHTPQHSPASTPRESHSPERHAAHDVTRSWLTPDYGDVKSETYDANRNGITNSRTSIKEADDGPVLHPGGDKQVSQSLDSLTSCEDFGEDAMEYYANRLRYNAKQSETRNTNGATRLFPNRPCETRHNSNIVKSVMERESTLKLGNGGKTASYTDLWERGEEDDPVWKKRDTLLKHEREALLRRRREMEKQSGDQSMCSRSATKDSKANSRNTPAPPIINADDGLGSMATELGAKTDFSCNKHVALVTRREVVVEWQTMAMVIDRLLFWIFLLATVVAYIVILFIIPYSKPKEPEDRVPMRVLTRS